MKKFSEYGMRELLYALAFIGIVFLIIFQYLGVAHGMYTKIPHYDKWLHSVGGTVCGTLGMAFLTYYVDLRKSSKKMIFATAVVFALLAGAMWELFQAFHIIPQFPEKITSSDTLYDLLFDGLGGLIAGGNVRRIHFELLAEEQERRRDRQKS